MASLSTCHLELVVWDGNLVVKSCCDVSYLKVVEDKLQLQRSHQYYEQCMGQMGLTGAKWCDIYLWCENDSHCEVIAFDASVMVCMFGKRDAFFASSDC